MNKKEGLLYFLLFVVIGIFVWYLPTITESFTGQTTFEEITEDYKSKGQEEALFCNLNKEEEGINYKLTAEIKYIESAVVEAIISYNLSVAEEENNFIFQRDFNNTVFSTVKDYSGFEYTSKLDDTQAKMRLTINYNKININELEELGQSANIFNYSLYQQDISSLKKYLEDQGYTCK